MITNVYGDGVLRMSNGTVGVFVHPDGTVGPPHTRDTQIAQAELVGAGFTISLGSKRQQRPMTDQEAAGMGPADPSIAGS